tara:strand:+ start:392 stop:787 length:396 start_codon:yes stop_codon:yes gene_type:complete
MSMCEICHKDSSEHSQRLWESHQQKQICGFCSKNGLTHSDELWEIHQLPLKQIRRGEKISYIQIGFGPKTPARVENWSMANPDWHEVDFIPIYLNCKECQIALGGDEVDYADLLNCLCINCFSNICQEVEM